MFGFLASYLHPFKTSCIDMTSPLLALPGEIRNLIYEHAVVHDREIPIRLAFDHRTNTAVPSAPATQRPHIAL